MGGLQIGIMADSLRLPFRESIEKCAELGADGVQLYAVSGEMSPDSMTEESLYEKKSILKGYGPVSYTHLDVYKRQPPHSGSRDR